MGREQLPRSVVEDEWRKEQIRGENGKKMREQDGEVPDFSRDFFFFFLWLKQNKGMIPPEAL